MNEGRKKILIVDDEAGVVNVIRAHMEASDYLVDQASNATEAAEKLKTANPSLVLLDIRLGDDSGFDVLKQIKQSHLDIPVILVTGYYDNDEAKRAFEAGAAEYITKPIDFYYLKSLLESQLM